STRGDQIRAPSFSAPPQSCQALGQNPEGRGCGTPLSQRPLLRKGDYVRVLKINGVFEKGYVR
ncbi:hypothetical protein JRQ81_017594, partial [Phrynocephalus forsythii]